MEKTKSQLAYALFGILIFKVGTARLLKTGMLYALHVSDKHQVKSVKVALESLGYLCKSRKIAVHHETGTYAIPVTVGDQDELTRCIGHLVPVDLRECPEPPSSNAPTTLGCTSLQSFAREFGLPDDTIAALGRWVIYPPMILFSCSVNTDLSSVPTIFWQKLLENSAKILHSKEKLTHIAQNRPIADKTDIVRIPAQIRGLYGDFGPEPTGGLRDSPLQTDFNSAFWCTASQNGIRQVWAPMYTMFSRGNIKEKARVLKFDAVKDSVVLDLYSGIGYFCFSYAKNRPKHIYCWEINPWSVEGLVRGARANKFNVRVVKDNEPYNYDPNDFIVVFMENNARSFDRFQVISQGAGETLHISHINMGLLPDCRLAWPLAKDFAALDSMKTHLHVHENVAIQDIEAWQASVASYMGGPCTHVEQIKTYAPGVMHVCGDCQVGGLD